MSSGLIVVCKLIKPLIKEGIPLEVLGLEIHHSASRNSSRTCFQQVLNFKYYTHLVSEFDSLSIRHTKLLVIVQNGVHVLNPEGINWPIEENPIQIYTFILVAFSKQLWCDPIFHSIGFSVRVIQKHGSISPEQYDRIL